MDGEAGHDDDRDRATPGVLSMFAPRGGAQRAVLFVAVAFLLVAAGYAAGARFTDEDPPGRDSAEVGFLYDMSAHHRQALQLAMLELANGSDPDAQVFAREILRSQSYEIGLMSMRLGEWGHDPGEHPAEAMTWMGMATDHDAMPGMADAAELAALRAAEGAEADALFYALMIDHHRGGVAMAEAAAERASDDWVAETAAAMARIQAQEIAEMARARDDAGLPAAPADVTPDPAEGGPAGEHGADHTSHDAVPAYFGELCDVLAAARNGEVDAARDRFDHGPLHELADEVVAVDRSVAARLLEAKQAVEADFGAAAAPADQLSEDLLALTVATRDAYIAAGQPDPGTCGQDRP